MSGIGQFLGVVKSLHSRTGPKFVRASVKTPDWEYQAIVVIFPSWLSGFGSKFIHQAERVLWTQANSESF